MSDFQIINSRFIIVYMMCNIDVISDKNTVGYYDMDSSRGSVKSSLNHIHIQMRGFLMIIEKNDINRYGIYVFYDNMESLMNIMMFFEGIKVISHLVVICNCQVEPGHGTPSQIADRSLPERKIRDMIVTAYKEDC